MEQEKIYRMELHDVIYVGDLRITRVSGGWIYTDNSGGMISSVFVPYSNEFYKSEPLKPVQPSINH